LGTNCHASDIVVKPLTPANHFKDTYKIDFSIPCAQEFINSIALQLHSFGADFLKLDGVAPGSEVAGFDNRDDIKAYSQALSQYQIWLELSSSVSIEYASFWRQYANGWRITGDVECYSDCKGLTLWSKIASRFSSAPKWTQYAGAGGWNDFDSVDVGNGAMDGITNEERQTVVTLWAISAAPLYTGDDLTKLDSYGLQLLTNDEVLAVNRAGKPASPVSQASPQQVWHVRYSNATVAVALFNLGDATATVIAKWSDIGLSGAHAVRDMWRKQNLGSFNNQYSTSLPSHGSQLLLIS